MKTISHEGEIVTASAGATDADVARYAARNGLAGLEFLIGIPGTVGGGLRMNAGAYGGEFKDITIRAHGFDRNGRAVSATPGRWAWPIAIPTHRQTGLYPCPIPRDHGRNRCHQGPHERDRQQPRRRPATRRSHWRQHLCQPDGRQGLAGDRFRRMPRHDGRRAQVSEKHCNFLINTGDACAHDIEMLGETVRQRVADGADPPSLGNSAGWSSG